MKELGYALTEEVLCKTITEIKKREGMIFIAEIDNKIIGCVSSIIDIRLAEGTYGEIVSLIVSHSFRGFGIGKNLTAKAEEWLIPKVKIIRVRANATRSEAHNFYKSLGFKEIKQQKILVKNV